MRWSNLDSADEQRARLPGYRDEAVVRHFEAPEAVETRFYEVRAKSILNRVPEASQVPFRWTINPYRGCTHACVYCLEGSTPVLLANGGHKPISELEVGEPIYGTRQEGSYRRYTITTVLDRWMAAKPAYRVMLADGTELITSADHRFLTNRGWKHVAKAPRGHGDRPHLTSRDDHLLGIGSVTGRAPRALEDVLEGRRVTSRPELGVVAVEPLGETRPLYDITTGTGDFLADGLVSHNCFARPTHTYLDFDAGRDFEREIVVKVNAPELLRAELARPSWQGEHVALGTNTDPYQWVEGRYKLMRGIWSALRDAANPCSVLTKSPLLLRDLDLMREINARTEFSAALSVPTLEERAWRATEPRTPHPRARLEAVAELTRAGIRTGILVAPLMPGINDDPRQVAPILEAAAEAGAAYVTGIGLHLRKGVREVFFEWLGEERPELVARYEALYGRRAYLARLVNGPDVRPGTRMRAMMVERKETPKTRSPVQTTLF
jgi:DNA repair photolyase